MRVSITGIEIWGIFTPLWLTALVVGGLLLDTTFLRKRPRALGVYSLVGLIVILFLQFVLHIFRLTAKPAAAIGFLGEYYFDVYSVYFNYIFLIAAIVTVAASLTYFADKDDHRGEYYLLIPIAVIGMCLMAAAHDLLILFIGLETMSIAAYVLVGFERGNLKSNEASIKYLLLGAFASAILLYGIALVYGSTGSISYREISGSIAGLLTELEQMSGSAATETGFGALRLSLGFGVLLLLVGLFFKVAAVPFHMWTPDVYEGAPTPVSAFMATGVKAAAFAGLVRLVLVAFTGLWGGGALYHVLYLLAVLTMVLGNIVAIAQHNLKRLLAYSSIAHAGYLMVGVTALAASGQFLKLLPGGAGMSTVIAHGLGASSAVLFYLLAYTFMNLGAFGVIIMVQREKADGDTLEGFAGLARKRPALAAVMAVCMLSLAGVPPLAGFAAKFYIFQAAVSCRLYFLAVIGVLASVVSAYYYLRVVVVMYMNPERAPFPSEPGLVTSLSLTNALMAVMVVLIGLFPQPVLSLLNSAFSDKMINLVIH